MLVEKYAKLLTMSLTFNSELLCLMMISFNAIEELSIHSMIYSSPSKVILFNIITQALVVGYFECFIPKKHQYTNLEEILICNYYLPHITKLLCAKLLVYKYQ